MADCELPSGEVHVWHGDLSQFRPEDFLGLLNAEERARHDRFVIARVAERFAICRGLLRRLIGRYQKIAPERVTFSYGSQGKPECDGLFFNLSHSAERMTVAFCADGPVGLDIEFRSDRLHARDIAGRYFSASECRQLETPDDTEFFRRFYRLWTAKEAVMKATGLGFALALSRIEIGLDPLAVRRLDGDGLGHWQLMTVDPAPEFTGTLAAAGGRLVCCDLVP